MKRRLFFSRLVVGILSFLGVKEIPLNKVSIDTKPNENLYYKDTSSYTIMTRIPHSYPSLVFQNKDNSKVGELTWGTGNFVFDGNVEQSAKVFFDYLNEL